uniref:Uncharacterized protein n=2 Tax=viral metagenome TaxID=1070528 RepID=A0A6M3L9T8_9ZZZZ
MSELTREQEEYVKENCEPVDLEGMYKEMLDECYGTVQICGMEYDASYVLKEIDPTAYRCGMSDYEYCEELMEIDGEYYMPNDVEMALEELADLQEEEEEEEEDDD